MKRSKRRVDKWKVLILLARRAAHVRTFDKARVVFVNTPSSTNRTILIADDETPIRLVVGEKFRSAGYTVIEARDGEEAIELAMANHIDAVVTDLQMPYVNGLELAIKLRQTPATANVPVLLLTARGHILSESDLAQTNIQRVMSKPFGVRDLLAYVQTTLAPMSAPATAGTISCKSTSEAA